MDCYTLSLKYTSNYESSRHHSLCVYRLKRSLCFANLCNDYISIYVMSFNKQSIVYCTFVFCACVIQLFCPPLTSDNIVIHFVNIEKLLRLVMSYTRITPCGCVCVCERKEIKMKNILAMSHLLIISI